MRILIIDDSTEDRFLFKKYINNSSSCEDETTIEECNTLDEALKTISKSDFDVILLDLALPGTDGTDTIKKLLEGLKNVKKNIPIVILTGSEDHTIGKNAFKMGVKDFLVKHDIDEKELCRSIRYATYDLNFKDKKSVKSKKK